MKQTRVVKFGIVSVAIWASGVVAHADTVAYWQFDGDGGGTYSNASVGAGAYNLVAVGGPFSQSGLSAGAVPNPDATVGFVGSPSANAGSLFSVSNQARYMATSGDGSAGLTLAGSSRWTMEGWYNLYAGTGPTIDMLWTTRDSSSSFVGLSLHVNVAGELEFVVQQTGLSTNLLSGAGFTTTGLWHHVAMTFDGTAGANGLFEMFMNGSSVGTLALPVAMNRVTIDTGDVAQLRFAGRAASTNSLAGRLDEWRLSDAVLAPDQFLNYVPEPSTAALILCGLAMAWRRGRRNAPRVE